MNRGVYIIILLLFFAALSDAQEKKLEMRGHSEHKEIPDSLLRNDSTNTNRRITAFHLTPYIGDQYVALMDTDKYNFAKSTLAEGQSIAMGYLANIGSPGQSRVFSERKESRDFIFADAYDQYITTPNNACFYDTKVPYTNLLYTTAGGMTNKEERFKGVMTFNFGPSTNVGGDFDYIYSRGHYNNNGNKLLSYRFFGSHKTPHYEIRAYLSNFNFINYENGGLANDSTITHPDDYFSTGKRQTDTKAYEVRLPDEVWNRVRGKQYFLTHRYNLGFWKDSTFVPVSSIIHTFQYEDNRRRFISKNQSQLDLCYLNDNGTSRIFGLDSITNDVTSAWSMKNTFALSLREGFQEWAKFGLTAFITFDKRKFRLPAQIAGLSYESEGRGLYPSPTSLKFPVVQEYDEFSTYIGAELSKRLGSLLTYDARGELCVVGDDIGEFRASGNLQTNFKLFNKDAIIRAEGYIWNVTPAFYLRHFHSRYFWWDNNLHNIQQFYAGGKINLESTKTQVSAGVVSIQNYVYFNKKGFVEQDNGNIQVVSARLKQDLHFGALGWENEAIFQLPSNKDIIPLPRLSLNSNLYLAFKAAKVLTVQIGADCYLYSSYYAPYYEPATQQFQLQNEVMIGNYPLVNAYVNFHLKQARFFIMAYNLSSKFANPNYFSFAHYPLNPMVLKMGVSVYFNN